MNKLLAVVVVSVAVCAINSCLIAASKPFLNNEEIYRAAMELESAEQLQEVVSPEIRQKRVLLQYNFARPIKSQFAKDQFEQVNKVSNEYKFKAYEFVNDNKKSNKKDWFSGLKKMIGPMGAMKNLAKRYKVLQDINDRYERQASNGLLTHDDVDCDLLKFMSSAFYNIYFVLSTDIKYLITGEQEILNRAIYEQLKEDRFSSAHNFYETRELNARQRELLLDYFSNHVDPSVTDVGSTVDHFYNPGEFISGRLLDTCHGALQFEKTWKNLESQTSDVCKNSRSDRNQANFLKFYSTSKYTDVFSLCHGLFDAM